MNELRTQNGTTGAIHSSSSPAAGVQIPGQHIHISPNVNGRIECAGAQRVTRPRRAPWDPADDQLLLDIVAAEGERSWAGGAILRKFNESSESRRTLPALKKRYGLLRSKFNIISGTQDKWSEAEDTALLDLCKPYESRKIQWKRDHLLEEFCRRTGVERTIDGMRKRWEFLKRNLRAETPGDDGSAKEIAEETSPAGHCNEDTASAVLEEQCAAGVASLAKSNVFLLSPRGEKHVAVAKDERCGDEAVTADVAPLPLRMPSATSVSRGNCNNDGEEEVATESNSRNSEAMQLEVSTWSGEPVRGECPMISSDDFKHFFSIAVMKARMGFVRRPLRKPKHAIPSALLSYGSNAITDLLPHIPEQFSYLGWLDTLVYAAGYVIEKLIVQQSKEAMSAVCERAWFQEKEDFKTGLQADVCEIEAELERRKQKKPPSQEELRRINILRAKYSNVRTVNLIRIAAYKRELIRIIDNRIRLRVADRTRREFRMRFRAEPKLSNLVGNERPNPNQMPTVHDILRFWQPIIGQPKETDFLNNDMLREWSEGIGQTEDEFLPDVAMLRETLTEEIRKGKAWKACGPDGIPLYYWKHLDSARDALLEVGPQMILTGRFPFQWLCRGRTVLIFKKGDVKDPSCYRPITCLNTVYKIFTGVIRVMCHQHLAKLNITPVEQRGLRESQSNCLHVCMTDQVLAYDAIYRRHPLCVCWLDFRKAFDSVNHSYLKWAINASRLPTYVAQFISRSMKYWRTSFCVTGSSNITPPIRVRNGIYQGDSLSPELFVLAIAPISYALNKHGPALSTSVGRATGMAVSLNHQCYIDDIKLYGRSEHDVKGMVRIVEVTAHGIGMSLNRDKCAILSHVPGEAVMVRSLSNVVVNPGSERESYTYLGITQQLLQVQAGVDDVADEILGKARIVFSSQLNWNLMVTAVQTLVLARLRYLFTVGSRSWRKLSMMMHFANDIDIALRKLMVECKVRYKAAAVSRLYLSRSYGGLGMPSAVTVAQESVVEACAYVLLHPQMRAVCNFHTVIGRSGKRNIISDCNAVLKEFNVSLEFGNGVVTVTDADASKAQYQDHAALARSLKLLMKVRRNQNYMESWKCMPLAGKLFSISGIDPKASFYWLEKGATSPIVVRNIIAAQENCLLTRACPGSSSSDKTCRKCGEGVETVDHVLSHCATWLPTLYVARHDKVARCVYFKLCKQYGLPIVHYTNQVPACVSNDNAEVIWDAIIPTAGRIHHNRPDIVVYDKQKRLVMIFEFAVASVSGLVKQRLLKINRYTVNSGNMPEETTLPYPPGPNLKEELRRQYNCEVRFIPVIVGTTGEFLRETSDDIGKGWQISPRVLKDVMERMARCAALGSHRVICNHLA